MGDSANPPQPPGLTSVEKDLLAKQGVTLDKFNEILNQSTLDSAETQNLLRQISGLYVKKETKGSRQPGLPIQVPDIARIDDMLNRMNTTGEVFKSPVTGQTMAPSELERAKTDSEYAAQLGFVIPGFGPDRVTSDKTEWVLDEAAVNKLRDRVAAETLTQQKISDLSSQRYIDALEGKTPLSSGLLQQKQTDFRLLREAAARRGIAIEGDDPATATSQSTAGNELVGQFKRTYGLLEDSERRAVIEGGAPQVAPSSTIPLSYVQGATASGPTGLLPTYSNLSSQYAGEGSPYQQQRLLGYQGQVAGYNAGQQSRGATAGLLAAGAGTAATIGGPWGWGAAGLLGLSALGAAYL